MPHHEVRREELRLLHKSMRGCNTAEAGRFSAVMSVFESSNWARAASFCFSIHCFCCLSALYWRVTSPCERRRVVRVLARDDSVRAKGLMNCRGGEHLLLLVVVGGVGGDHVALFLSRDATI